MATHVLCLLSELASTGQTARQGEVGYDVHLPQAGRRGFDPRLPLLEISGIESPSKLSTALLPR